MSSATRSRRDTAPLRELAFDPREGIAVSLGGVTTDPPVVLRHVIAAPTRVETTDEPGVPAALMIDAEDGVRTLLRLEPVSGKRAVRPDDRMTRRLHANHGELLPAQHARARLGPRRNTERPDPR